MAKIALLNIGSELLKGRTLNTNSAWIGEKLKEYGWTVEETLVIHDEADSIKRGLSNLMSRNDAIIITGGLGPTKDDITKPVLMEIFGGEMVRDEETDSRIRKWYEMRQRQINDFILLQALVPSSCTVMTNLVGTAPGMRFDRGGIPVYSLPGVPQEMRHLMEHKVIPDLQKRFPVSQLWLEVVKIFGFPESEVAIRMQTLQPRFNPGVQVAYLPTDGQLKLELSLAEGQGRQEDLIAARQMMEEEFAPWWFTSDDRSLEEVLGEELKKLGKTLALAESATGGALASRITSVSGASKYFLGSMVTYSNQAKCVALGLTEEFIETHGVVSEQVALAMAEGTRERLKADFGIGITGTAQVYPNDPDYGQPVIWFGVATPAGSFTRKGIYHQDRASNIRHACNTAMFLALRELRK